MIEFSPDWDSRYGYLLVFLGALVSARFQVYKRLEVLKGKQIYAWSLYRTWLVFGIYLALPLLLFWLLDRTGSIHDTSLFSAVLVSLAYPAILAGGTSLKPAGGILAVFDWLNQAADGLVKRTAESVAVEERIFRRSILTAMTADTLRHDAVLDVARLHAEAPDAMDREMAETTTVQERAEIAYDYATSSAYGLRPLDAVTSKWQPAVALSPYRRTRRWVAVYLAGSVVLLALTYALVFIHYPSDYAIWRLFKPGTGHQDLHRSVALLESACLAQDPGQFEIESALVRALQRPGIELARTDEAFRLLLLRRGASAQTPSNPVPGLLIDSLRARSVDVRSRAQNTLLMLAHEQPPVVGSAGTNSFEDLKAWKPLSADSTTEIESRIRKWERFWNLQR